MPINLNVFGNIIQIYQIRNTLNLKLALFLIVEMAKDAYFSCLSLKSMQYLFIVGHTSIVKGNNCLSLNSHDWLVGVSLSKYTSE